MQKQGSEGSTDAEIFIQQDTQSPNVKDHTLIVKMSLPKQIIGVISSFLSKKRQSNRHIQNKEQSPEGILIRAKAQQYRKFDDRTKDQHRRQLSEHFRCYMQVEQFLYLKQKFSYSVFQPFTDRGKNPNIKFSHQKMKQPNQNILQIKFNKKYFLQQLKLTRTQLFSIPGYFVSTWESDFIAMVKIVNKMLSQGTQKSYYYTVYLRSIDLISFTFDVQYADKKTYRFRYSPYQFRSSLFSKQPYQLVGYNQCISVIPEINTKSGGYSTTSSDQDFYLAPRCFIFDDLTDSNTFIKIVQKTNIFYTAYSISKGIMIQGGLQADEFCKKYLWQLYFDTTRLKKFIYTWSFKPFKRITTRLQNAVREIEVETRQIIFHVPFYLKIRDNKQHSKDDFPYRVRVQYQDFYRNLPIHVKQEIIHRARDWYITYKQNTINNRDNSKQKNPAQQQRILQQQKRQRERLREAELERPKVQPDRQQTELEMYFGNRDRFDRFLLGMLVIISSVLERNHFTMLDQKQKYPRVISDVKYAVFDTPQSGFVNKKHQHLHHYHWLEIYFQSKILPYLFKQQRQKTNLKANDTRYKCAEWKLHKIIKCKRQWNRKTEKAGNQTKGLQVLTLNQVFKDYIDILLKHFSLKFIYKDIINFVQGIGKNCYMGWQQHNTFEANIKNQTIFKVIVSAILQLYYYNPLKIFKEKQLKALQKAILQKRNIDKQQQQRVLEQQRIKKEDIVIDQFFRVVVVKILTKGDMGFMPDDKLSAEVTFRIMEYKSCWITRMKQGFIILRIYDDRIDFQRQYEKVDSLKFNMKMKNVPFEEQQLKQKFQRISSQIKTTVLA